MRCARSWMIHRSCRASPGSGSACAAHLHLAVGVGDGAVLLRPGRGRQDDVGVGRGLGQEDVLHHEMLEMRERAARVVEVGVRHRGVLAHDVHALDLVGVHRVHDLDHGLAALGIERHAPGRLVLGADFRRSPPTCSRGRTSGSGRRRRRPARCSGRAADAARCRAGRSGRRSATARSGSARCRCRGCAATRPCPRR